MNTDFSVSLGKIIKELSLKVYYTPTSVDDIMISSTDINRPGLELTGYLEFFDNKRIIIFGNTEYSYLGRFGSEQQRHVLDAIFSFSPPAVIITRGFEPTNEIADSAKEHNIPILCSEDSTSSLSAALVSFLNNELAPRITRHGVLVEVYGEGCLIIGDSGVGKSEAAIELIKRGHRLIADDAVEIRHVSSNTLVGSSPENIRHFIELRGIGIINARRLFGIGAVKLTEKINMVISLELWDKKKVYDRMGIENEYMRILGIDVPLVTIPVKPGRNIAIIIEVAAMNNRQKKLGYNAAYELLESLGMPIDKEQKEKKIVESWE